MKKNTAIKLLSLLLCTVMLAAVFSGCNIGEETTTDPEENTTGETTAEQTSAEETTSEETSAEETTSEETSAEETTSEETSEPSLPEANVILFSGQSNAYGASPVTSEIREEAAKRDFSNVYINSVNINRIKGEWIICHESQGFVPFELGKENDTESSFSPLFGMVCYLIDSGYVTEDKPLYIIKYAAAQTVLNSQWLPSNTGQTADSGGLVETFGSRLAILMKDFISKSLAEIEKTHIPKIQSFVWIQGESDACYSYVTSGYAKAEISLVQSFRNIFGAYAGDNGITFIDYAIKERATAGKVWWKYATVINQAKRENAQYYFNVDNSFDAEGKLVFDYTENTDPGLDNSILISVEDFLLTKVEVGESKTDGAHFSSESAYTLGRIMGRSMLDMHGLKALDDDIRTDVETRELPEANVIIWSGQSNAYGSCPITADMRAEAAKRDFSNVYVHYSNINLRREQQLWEEFFGNDGFEQFTLGDEADGPNFFSPLFGTVCYLIDNGYVTEDKPLYIIKYTAAQTVLNSQWLPSNVDVTSDQGNLIEDLGGHLSILMDDFITASLNEIKKTHTPKIHAFVWIQGESDAQKAAVSKGYAQAEQELISRVREKYGKYSGDNGIVFINYAIKERATDRLWWPYAVNVNTAKKQNAQYYFDVDTSFADDGTLSLNYAENSTPGIDNSVLIAVEDFVLTKAEVGESATDGAHFSSTSGYQLGRIIGRVYRHALGETTEDDPSVSGRSLS